MIGHCDSSFLHRRFDRERIPLSHQLPAPSTLLVARQAISARDQTWAACKRFPVPNVVAVSRLRLRNDAVVKILATSPAPFPPLLTQVELLLCKVCEIFCARCDIAYQAEIRRPGNLTIDFVRRSLELVAAAEEESPEGAS
jgi:hypothetical protein